MTNFSDADVDALFESVTDLALRSAYFDSVNQHEPKSAPGNGLSMSVWIQTIKPFRLSGLASTTGVIVFNGRIYTSMLSQPFDAIDPNVTKAANWMLGAISGEFQLKLADTRNVDLLGTSGYALSAAAGYVEIDRKMFRVMTLQIPIIINDMWTQAP